MTGRQFQKLKIGEYVTPDDDFVGKGLVFVVTEKDLLNGEIVVKLLNEQPTQLSAQQEWCLKVYRAMEDHGDEIRQWAMVWNKVKK